MTTATEQARALIKELDRIIDGGPGRRHTAQQFAELESKLITGFYEERIPEFRQGAPKHELEDLVTAEECQNMANLIDHQRLRISELEAELSKVQAERDRLQSSHQRLGPLLRGEPPHPMECKCTQCSLADIPF